jgi:hypothetical protein
LTAIAGTSLLTLQNNQPVNNSVFLDSSGNNLLISRSGNATQGTFSPYSPSGWSNYFDGSGDYLDIGSAGVNLSANWTAEVWYYATAAGMVFDCRPNAVNGYYPTLGLSSTQIFVTVNANDIAITPPTSVLNAWNHVAFVKNNGVFTVYFNGASVYSVADANTWGVSGARPRLGANGGFFSASNGFYTGYISNLRIVNGTAVYTGAFTPPAQPLTAIAGTYLLTCADNRFMDESPNKWAITRTGDARVTNFSPFKAVVQTPVTYSGYFDGNGDRLQIPSTSALDAGAGDFCIECWFFGIADYNSYAVTYAALANKGSGNESGTYGIAVYGGKLYASLAGSLTQGTTTLTPGVWYHGAVTRSGSTVRLFLNGVLEGTATSTANFSSSANFAIGDRQASDPFSQYPFNGYISNVRLVKGDAVYTANFTPPTAPLTAIAGTSLLTCQSATFVDASTNRFAITAAGNSQPTTVNPFGSSFTNSTGYTAAEYSGSVYFDGSGDCLTIPSNAALALGTSDFTLDCWIWATSAPSDVGIFESRTNGTSTLENGFTLTAFSSSVIRIYCNGVLIASSGTSYVNTWCHVAVVRSAGTWNLYINGVSQGTNTASRNMTNNDAVIGAGRYTGTSAPSAFFPGYISDFRLIKGQAVYASNFVPPAAPVAPVANTVLLLNGTSAAISDSTTKNNLETVGDAKISTAVSKFGSSSMLFDGTGDYLTIPASPNLVFGTGAFTIEVWVNRNSSGDVQHFMDFRGANNNDYNPVFYWLSNNFLHYTNNNTSGDYQIQTSNPITSSSGWVHLALVRSGTTLTIYVNGVASGSVSYSTDVRGGNPVFIGSRFNINGHYSGYMQDFRITRGVARYTANFTPPSSAFQAK